MSAFCLFRNLREEALADASECEVLLNTISVTHFGKTSLQSRAVSSSIYVMYFNEGSKGVVDQGGRSSGVGSCPLWGWHLSLLFDGHLCVRKPDQKVGTMMKSTQWGASGCEF